MLLIECDKCTNIQKCIVNSNRELTSSRSSPAFLQNTSHGANNQLYKTKAM